MILEPGEAEKLKTAYCGVYGLNDSTKWGGVQRFPADVSRVIREVCYALEDLRPAGGFSESIDPKYCKECGRLKENEK